MKKIYEAIVQAGRPYKLPGHWNHVPCDRDFFRLPADRAAILAGLRQQFTDADLLGSGVVIKPGEGSGAGGLQWHPSLVADQVPIWAIRAQDEAEPTQLIANMGTVGQKTWSLIVALGDHRQSQLIYEADGQVVVAYSMADLAILRSVGIAAVPGDNWSSLSKPQLAALCRAMENAGAAATRPSPGAAMPVSHSTGPASLIVANWSLSSLGREPIAAATATWTHLAQLHKHLDLPFDSFGCWTPTQKDLDRLAYQVRYREIAQIRTSLLGSIEQDSLAIDAEDYVEPRPVTTIADALRAWRRAEGDAATSPAARQQAYEHLCELIERQRFTPLMEEALQVTSPPVRNAEILLAETGRLLAPQMLLLTEKLRRSVGEKGTQTEGGFSKDEFKQVLELIDRQLKLTEVVQACRGHRPVKQRPPRKVAKAKSPTTPPSAAAASPPPKPAP